MNWNENKDKRIIQVITPTSIFEPGFLSDIMKAIPNIIFNGRHPENKIGKDKQEIGNVYSFSYFGKHRGATTNQSRKTPFKSNDFYIHAVEYRDFSKLYMKFNEKSHVIKINFTDKVVIFDEAHRLFRQFDMCDPDSMIIDKYIYNMLLGDSKHVIFMTGTPMKQDLVSMFKLYNLIDALNSPGGNSKFNIDKLSNYDKYIKFSSKQGLGFNAMHGLKRTFVEWCSFKWATIKGSQKTQTNQYLVDGWFSYVINAEESTKLVKELSVHLFNKKKSSWLSLITNRWDELGRTLGFNTTIRNNIEDIMPQVGGEPESDYDNNEHKCDTIMANYDAENYQMAESDSGKLNKIMNYYLMSIKNKIIKDRKDQSKTDDELSSDEIKIFKDKIIQIVKNGVYKLQIDEINYASDIMTNSVSSKETIKTYDGLFSQYDEDKEQLINMEVDMQGISSTFSSEKADAEKKNKMKDVLGYIQEQNEKPTSQIITKPIEVVTKIRSFEGAILSMDMERIKELLDDVNHDEEVYDIDIDEQPEVDEQPELAEGSEINYQSIIEKQKESDPDLEFTITYEEDGLKDKALALASRAKDSVVGAKDAVVGAKDAVVGAVVDAKNEMLPSVLSTLWGIGVGIYLGQSGGKKYDNKVVDECTSEFKRFMFASKLKGKKNVLNMINLLKPEAKDSINEYYNKMFEKKEMTKEQEKLNTRELRLKKFALGGSTIKKDGGRKKKGTRKKKGGSGQVMMRSQTSSSDAPDQSRVRMELEREKAIREKEEKKAKEEAFKPFSGKASGKTGQGPISDHFNAKFDSIYAEFKKMFVNETAIYYFLKEEGEANLKLLQKNTKPEEQNSVYEGKIQLYTDLIKFYGNVIEASKLQHTTLFENISNIKRIVLMNLTGSSQQYGGGIELLYKSVISLSSYVFNFYTSGSLPIMSTLNQMKESIFNYVGINGLGSLFTLKAVFTMGGDLIVSGCKAAFANTIVSILSTTIITLTVSNWSLRHLISALIHFLKFSGYSIMSMAAYVTHFSYYPGYKMGGEYSAKRNAEFRLMVKSLYYGFFNGMLILRYQNQWDQLRKAKKLGDRTSITHYMYSLLKEKNGQHAFVGYRLENIISDSKDFISSVNPEMKSINSPIFNLLKHTNISLFEKVNESEEINLIKKGVDEVIVYPKLAVNVILNTYTPEQSLLYNALEKKNVNIIMPLRLEFLPCFFNQAISANKRYISNCYDNIHSVTDSKLNISGNPIVKYEPFDNKYVDNRKKEYQTEIKSEKFDKLLKRLLLMKTGYMVDEDNGFLVTQPHITSKHIYGSSLASNPEDDIKNAESEIVKLVNPEPAVIENAIEEFIKTSAAFNDAKEHFGEVEDDEERLKEYKKSEQCKNSAINARKNKHQSNIDAAQKIITAISKGNVLAFKEATKILQKGVKKKRNGEEYTEGPNCSMKQISEGIVSNPPETYFNFLPFVYSSSDVVGLNLFARYLDQKGFKYKIMHDESPDSIKASEEAIQTNYRIKHINEGDAYDYYLKYIKKDTEYISKQDQGGTDLAQQREAVNTILNPKEEPEWVKNVKKTGDPICILLHPFKTEGIDGKYNPAIFFLDNPRNYGDYNQLCGRILRTYGQPNSTKFTNYDSKIVKQKNSENMLKRIYYGSKKYDAVAAKNLTYDKNDELFGTYLEKFKPGTFASTILRHKEDDLVIDAKAIRGTGYYHDIVETLKRAYPIITSTESVFYEMAMSNYGKYYTKNKDVHTHEYKDTAKITEFSDIEFGQLEDFFFTRKPNKSASIGKIEKNSDILTFKDQISTFITNDIFNHAFLNISNLNSSDIKIYDVEFEDKYASLRRRIDTITQFYGQDDDRYTDGDYGNLAFSKLQVLSSVLENHTIYNGMKNRYADITKLYFTSNAESSVNTWMPNQRYNNPFYNDKKEAVAINRSFNTSVANALYTQKIIELLHPSFGLELLVRTKAMGGDEKKKYLEDFDSLNINYESQSQYWRETGIKKILSSVVAEDKYAFNQPLFKEYMKIIDMYDTNTDNIKLNNLSIELDDYMKLKKVGSEFTTLIREYVSGEDDAKVRKIQDLTDIANIYKGDNNTANKWETLRPWNDVFSNMSHDNQHNVIHINRSSEYSDYMIRTDDGTGDLQSTAFVGSSHYSNPDIIKYIEKINDAIYEGIKSIEEELKEELKENSKRRDEIYKHIDNIVRFFKHAVDKKCIFDGVAHDPPIFTNILPTLVSDDVDALDTYISAQTDAILIYIVGFNQSSNFDDKISERYEEIGKIDSLLLNMSTNKEITLAQRMNVYKQIYLRQSNIFSTFLNRNTGDGDGDEIYTITSNLCKNILYLVFLYKQLYTTNVALQELGEEGEAQPPPPPRPRPAQSEQAQSPPPPPPSQQAPTTPLARPSTLPGGGNKTRRKSIKSRKSRKSRKSKKTMH